VSFDRDAVARDVPLAPRTTLELGGRAGYFYEATSEATLLGALAWAQSEGLGVTMLAGGSNVVVADDGVAGLVIAPRIRRLTSEVSGRTLRLFVGAGEPWDDVVAHAVACGASGIECLSGIPGWAGATPIQNVGAYGQEVADVLTHVHVIDRRTRATRVLRAADCAFAYRDSRFKRERDTFIVTGIVLELPLSAPARPRYAELDRALPEDADLATIRSTVIALRRAKSMVLDAKDPNRRSAGSFFTNPIVDDTTAEHVIAVALRERLVTAGSAVPRHRVSSSENKLAAAWLIERSGFAKGTREGAFGISSAHALAIVHHGGGRTTELLAFAAHVQAAVLARFGVSLEREPVLLG
jgi:UDP-N-acetylmuramate dehydrogenase